MKIKQIKSSQKRVDPPNDLRRSSHIVCSQLTNKNRHYLRLSISVSKTINLRVTMTLNQHSADL